MCRRCLQKSKVEDEILNTNITKCPYKYYSPYNSVPQNCMLKEGHEGEHKYLEVLPQPQQYPRMGWYKD